MEFNIDKIPHKLLCFKELNTLKCFKQFNVYQNIELNNRRYNIKNIQNIIPALETFSIKISNANIVNTAQCTSLEGQRLSGKKLIIVGSINMDLVLTYHQRNRKKRSNKESVIKVEMPFSTFIVTPNDICENQKVNLRYLVEDVSVINISQNKLLISSTMLIQYLDEC